MATAPDLIVLNGRALTFDDDRPEAEALAVVGGDIAAVGSTAEIREMKGPGTRIVDAGGATILPGFIDSHVHLFAGSVEMSYPDLTGISGEDALRAFVRRQDGGAPLLFCVQADYGLLDRDRPITRQALDRIVPDRPFAAFSADHHTMWANTRALEMAGILHGGPVDPGATIVMGEDGTATGELKEFSAFAPVLRHTRHGGRDLAGLATGRDPDPAASAEERARDRDVIAQGLKHCASHGITGLHNMDGNFYTLELLEALEADGRLICRAEVPFHFKPGDPLDRFEEAAEMRRRWSGETLWSNRVKMFMDGVVESGTALMIDPYPGRDHCGDAVFEPEEFDAACIRADAMGLQLSTHAIGDLAVRRTLNGYQAAREANGARDARHRIEHIEVLHPDDLPRFAELGVVASIQPGHSPFGGVFPPEGPWRMLHPHQIPNAYAWQDLRDSGAEVIFSTDWPVMPVDVTANIKAAIAPIDLPPPWRDHRQGLRETLRSYTAGNAWVEFNEARIGRLKPGMRADIAVMSADLEATPPGEIDRTRAVLTICGGTITHEA